MTSIAETTSIEPSNKVEEQQNSTQTAGLPKNRPTTGARWNEVLLDQMREQGDPPADRVIQALFANREVAEARRLLRTFVLNDVPPPSDLPSELLEFLAATDPGKYVNHEQIQAGQELFAEHGPLILMCLAHYSLPAAYAAANGVQVLHRTAYLEKRPAKRLFETTQMVIDVMSPGGLEAGGRGVRTAQKVRLMHAMVRHLIQNDHQRPWDPSLGVPINQEDLAGTLMTFSWITLDGLAKLGIHPPAAAQAEYLAAWCSVGRLLGIKEELLPATMAEAEQLTRLIQARQVAPSEAGRLMTAALLEMIEEASDAPCLRRMSGALMRHFLPEHVAEFLGIPEHALDSLCVEVLSLLAKGADSALNGLPHHGRAAHRFSHHFIQWMVNVELGGRSAPFVIPAHLRKRWRFDATSEPSFLTRLAQWLGRIWNGIL